MLLKNRFYNVDYGLKCTSVSSLEFLLVSKAHDGVIGCWVWELDLVTIHLITLCVSDHDEAV